jgi:hypothetical protein
VLFTSALNSTKNLDTISVKENGVVYFYVSFSPLENRGYDSVCRILDWAQREVYTGRANLRASGNRLTTWCWYYFHRGVDKPGEWVFEFSLDGQNIVQKHLTVLP